MAEIETRIYYEKAYRLQAVGEDGLTTMVSMPPEVIRREAKKRSITVQEFIKLYRAVAHYNSIEGVLYTFESVEKFNKDDRPVHSETVGE